MIIESMIDGSKYTDNPSDIASIGVGETVIFTGDFGTSGSLPGEFEMIYTYKGFQVTRIKSVKDILNQL